MATRVELFPLNTAKPLSRLIATHNMNVMSEIILVFARENSRCVFG